LMQSDRPSVSGMVVVAAYLDVLNLTPVEAGRYRSRFRISRPTSVC